MNITCMDLQDYISCQLPVAVYLCISKSQMTVTATSMYSTGASELSQAHHIASRPPPILPPPRFADFTVKELQSRVCAQTGAGGAVI